MKASEKRKIIKLESDLQDYYNFWFFYWYSGEDWDLSESGDWEWWYDYENDVNRIRQERLDEIFDVNKPDTIEDIWPIKNKK